MRSRQCQLPGHVLAFGPAKLEPEPELVALFPSALRQQGAASHEVLQGRGVGGCRLGSLSRDEVEPGDLLSLLLRDDHRRAAVELVHGLEDLLFEGLGRGVRREQSADPEMRHRALGFADERISRLADAVVEECVGPVRADHQSGTDGVPQRRVHRLLALPIDEGERGRFGGVPETSQVSQRLLGRRG